MKSNQTRYANPTEKNSKAAVVIAYVTNFVCSNSSFNFDQQCNYSSRSVLNFDRLFIKHKLFFQTNLFYSSLKESV